MKLKNKVALITAGGGSIGGSQAKLFAQEGAKVAVADIDLSKAKIISNQILNNAGESFPIKLDVKDSDSWQNAVKEILTRYGTINILCNMIASLHDKDRKITIPSFYDQVEVISDSERKDMAKSPFSLDRRS